MIFSYVPSAKYLYTTNTATELGITNSVEEVAVGIVLNDQEDPIGISRGKTWRLKHIPQYILLKLTNPKHANLSSLGDGIIPVKPIKNIFQVGLIEFFYIKSFIYLFKQVEVLKNGKQSSVSITRVQFSLIPSYAITDYKCQGETYDAAIVDLAKPSKGKSNLSSVYVPLSRVRNLEDLAILRPFENSRLTPPPNDDLEFEIKRLKRLEANATRNHKTLLSADRQRELETQLRQTRAQQGAHKQKETNSCYKKRKT